VITQAGLNGMFTEALQCRVTQPWKVLVITQPWKALVITVNWVYLCPKCSGSFTLFMPYPVSVKANWTTYFFGGTVCCCFASM